MTITSSPSAPLFVVIGSTGTQGHSVIDAISKDSKEYRVRGITRDPSKSAAQELKELGCEVVAGDVDDANSIEKAFEGAEIVFAMTNTNYWAPDGEEKVCIRTRMYYILEVANVIPARPHSWLIQERNQGKMLVDTAKKAGAKVFIWSGLPSHAALSHGKHPVWR